MSHEASCGEIRLIYRLTRIAGAAGDNAASPRLPMTLNLVLKAKGDQRRSQRRDHLLRDRQSLARCRRIVADRRELAENCSAKDGPLDLIGYREHRPHRDQSADRACAEIGGPRFPHRLSAEGVSLRRASAAVSRKRRWKTRSTATRILADDSLKREFKAWLLDPSTSRRVRSRHAC